MSLFRWQQEGRIAHYRIGHRVFYSDRHIAAFLASVERQPLPARRSGDEWRLHQVAA
jgi:hypothetical protein